MIVRVERMSYGPDGIAHLDSGKVVFVEHGVPGDELDIEIIEEKSRMARGRIVDVVTPSEYRIQEAAPELFDSLCPWENMAYDYALQQKRQIVVDALGRVGRIPSERLEAIVGEAVPSPQPWGYRNKLEMATAFDAQGHLELGFHRQGSDAIQVVQSCAIGNSLIEKAPKKLSGALRFSLGDAASDVFRVGVRGSTVTKSLEVALWTTPGPFPRDFVAKTVKDATQATSIVRVIAKEGSERRVKRIETLSGTGYWKERLAGCTFKVSAPSFFQVNTAQAEQMVELVIDALGDVEGMMIADLYCGVGTFSVPLAKRGADLLCIELAGSSVANLRENLASAEVEADVICDDVERVLPELEDLDAVIVDPPRAGLAESVIQRICESGASKMVYISCDPQTLARDIARLEERGATLEHCIPVDLFPQTYHIECVCSISLG